MEKSIEKFDGELVITADREIHPDFPLMVSIIDGETGQKNTPGPLLLEYLATLEEIAALSTTKQPNNEQIRDLRVKKASAEAMLKIMAFHERMINKRLLEMVTEGKVKVGLWVDSGGGSVDIAEKVKFAIDYLRRNGALMSSYVNIKAASAAFDLAFMASEVNAMTKSIFNWHFSDSEESPRIEKVTKFRRGENLDEDSEDELIELRDILETSHSSKRDDLWRTAMNQLNNKQNPEGDIVFEGDYLHEVGLVDNCYRRIEDLIAKFKSDLPLHAQTNATFFTAGVSERVAHLIRHQPHWLDPRTLAMTTRVARQLENGRPTARQKVKLKKKA